MSAENHFITRGLLRVKIDDYLRNELRRAGYAGVELQKTPLGMRVIVYAARPGIVIGRRGVTVRELTETLESEFGLEAPQIEVNEVEVPELNGAVMAERLSQRLERGDHFRRAAYGVLRRIMGAGAVGVEISIKGKLTSRRARYQKFKSGFVAKTGEPVRYNVSAGTAFSIMKLGIIGVQVRIMLPNATIPDRPSVQHKEQAPQPVPVKAGEIEIIEEAAPIEEAPSLEEFQEEGEEISSEVAEPAQEEIQPKEPVTEETPKEPEVTPPTREDEEIAPSESKEKEAKPKAKAKAKGEPKTKPKAEVAEKPKAKSKPKEKAKGKAKAEPKTKPKAEVAEKPKTKAKPKEKTAAAEKPKTKTKQKTKPKAKSGKEKTKAAAKDSASKS